MPRHRLVTQRDTFMRYSSSSPTVFLLVRPANEDLPLSVTMCAALAAGERACVLALLIAVAVSYRGILADRVRARRAQPRLWRDLCDRAPIPPLQSP